MERIGITLLMMAAALFIQTEASGHQGMPPAVTVSSPFKPISTQTAKKQFANEEINRVIAAFKVDVEYITMMKKGESLLLENIEGRDYLLQITGKHYFKNDTTVNLRCTHMQTPCNAVMHIGATNTVMHLQTSSESYEMEARNEVAYFYKSGLR